MLWKQAVNIQSLNWNFSPGSEFFQIHKVFF